MGPTTFHAERISAFDVRSLEPSHSLAVEMDRNNQPDVVTTNVERADRALAGGPPTFAVSTLGTSRLIATELFHIAFRLLFLKSR